MAIDVDGELDVLVPDPDLQTLQIDALVDPGSFIRREPPGLRRPVRQVNEREDAEQYRGEALRYE